MMKPAARIRALSLATLAVGALLLAGCSAPGTDDAASTPDGPITLEYWSWAPNIEKIVDVWNQANPDIQVNVNTSVASTEIVAKLAAAKQAGSLPDVSNTTYENLPNLVTSEIASDVTDIMGDREAKTAAPAWNLTTFGDANYAVPQGTAPMFLYYRADIFEQYGLTAPTTWDEYAATAAALHAADPAKYLATFPANDAQLFAALSQQAGAEWWSQDDGDWSVGIDDPASQKVADYWQGLVADGSIATFKTNTPEWQAALADGTLASWLGAVWTPPILHNNAPDTVGKWAAVPLPQWTPNDPSSGVLGGSGTIVTTGAKHPEQAKQFALWLNTSMDALKAYVTFASIWPATLEGRELPELQKPPALMPEQTDFYATAAEIDDITADVTWGPNVSVAYDAFTNAFSTAVNSGGSFSDALSTVQDAVVADMDKAGYDVSEAR
ncbi:ABC transporter substrate-binding protein [Herbiconiux sp. VKM Ac-2851]|uniref:ABC transporter substrate-binding protein n=1 Tax=Herbiconiux sp. VKM Ac-2851 TaxID=2739025 RepID=UPI0015648192|nr:extracellular solute-binding protein [Herbiconiux sp. VKM Ac-2851]NQX35019.1 extracellular solute-binding protein [Herbiconiux sp. VKM Ac-2851]